MKRLKLLWMILKRTKATQIILGFVLFLFANAAVIQIVEPNINRYGDALWYCYAVISTAGFGDFVAVTFIGKICSVLLTIYAIFVIAIVTGVVVNFYTLFLFSSHYFILLSLFFKYKIPIIEKTTAPIKFTIKSFIVSIRPMSRYPPIFHCSPLITTDWTST